MRSRHEHPVRAEVSMGDLRYTGYVGSVAQRDGDWGGPPVLELTLHIDETITTPSEETPTVSPEHRYHVHRKEKGDVAQRVASYPESDVDHSATEAAERALRDPSIMFADGDLLIVTEDEGETVFVFAVKRPEPRLQLVPEDGH